MKTPSLPTESRVPSLRELAQEYPGIVLAIIDNQDEPHKAMAEVRIPYGGDTLRWMRSIPGAHWHSERRVWRVPAYSRRRLAEALYVIATRSR